MSSICASVPLRDKLVPRETPAGLIAVERLALTVRACGRAKGRAWQRASRREKAVSILPEQAVPCVAGALKPSRRRVGRVGSSTFGGCWLVRTIPASKRLRELDQRTGWTAAACALAFGSGVVYSRQAEPLRACVEGPGQAEDGAGLTDRLVSLGSVPGASKLTKSGPGIDVETCDIR